MPQDAYALYHQAKELDALLSGGRVNKIAQPKENEIFLHIYAGGERVRLAVSANVAAARVCTSDTEKENPLAAYNFCMLLRKHLSAATLDGIALIGFDRIVKIDFTASGEFFDAEKNIRISQIHFLINIYSFKTIKLLDLSNLVSS